MLLDYVLGGLGEPKAGKVDIKHVILVTVY